MAEYADFLTALPENGGFFFRNDRGRETIRTEKHRIIPHGVSVRGIKHRRLQGEGFAAGKAVCIGALPQFPSVGTAREIQPNRRRKHLLWNGAEALKIRAAFQQFRLREFSCGIAEKGEVSACRTHAAVSVNSHGFCFLRAVIQKNIAAGKASDAVAFVEKRQIVERLTTEFLHELDFFSEYHKRSHRHEPTRVSLE